MSWAFSWLTSISNGLSRRVIRTVLHNFVGKYLKSKVRLDQISLDLVGGTAPEFQLSDLEIKVEALNEFLEGSPFEVVDGSIGTISGRIPIVNLFSEGCFFEFDRVEITLRARKKPVSETSSSQARLHDSLVDFSHDVAEELKREQPDEEIELEVDEGQEWLAGIIVAILSRIGGRVRSLTATLVYEHSNGVSQAVVLSLEDLQVRDKSSSQNVPSSAQQEQNVGGMQVKQIVFEGLDVSVANFKGGASHALHASTTRQQVLSSAGGEATLILQKTASNSFGRCEVEVFLENLDVFATPEHAHFVAQLAAFLSAPASPSPPNPPSKEQDVSDPNTLQLNFKVTVPDASIMLLFRHLDPVAHYKAATGFFKTHAAVLHNYFRKNDLSQDPKPALDIPEDHVLFLLSHASLTHGAERTEVSVNEMAGFHYKIANPNSPTSDQYFVAAPLLHFEGDSSLCPVDVQACSAAFPPDGNGFPLSPLLPRPRQRRIDPALRLSIAARQPVAVALSPCILYFNFNLIDSFYYWINMDDVYEYQRSASRSVPPSSSQGKDQLGSPDAAVVHVTCEWIRIVVLIPEPKYEPAESKQRPLNVLSPAPAPNSRFPPSLSLRQQTLWLDISQVSFTLPRLSQFNNMSLLSFAENLKGHSLEDISHQLHIIAALSRFRLFFSLLYVYYVPENIDERVGLAKIEGFSDSKGHDTAFDILLNSATRSKEFIALVSKPSLAKRLIQSLKDEERGLASTQSLELFFNFEHQGKDAFAQQVSLREDQNERLLNPADGDEISCFEFKTGLHAEYVVKIHFKSVFLNCSKSQLHLLYQAVTDVSMWEPTVPKNPIPGFSSYLVASHATSLPVDRDESGSHYDRDDDHHDEDDEFEDDEEEDDVNSSRGNSDEDENDDDLEDDSSDDSNEMYYSTWQPDSPLNRSLPSSSSSSASPGDASAKVLVHLLSLTLAMDELTANIMEERPGFPENVALGLRGKDFHLFSAVLYDGKPLKHVWVGVNELQLLDVAKPLFQVSFSPWKVDATIVGVSSILAERSAYTPVNLHSASRKVPMVQVGVSLAYDPVVHSKIITTALCLNQIKINHMSSKPDGHWIFRFMELMDFVDPIYENYISPGRMTKLHLHFNDLSIAYKPVHLSSMAVISAKRISLSSNIIPLSPHLVMTFRFIKPSLYMIDRFERLPFAFFAPSFNAQPQQLDSSLPALVLGDHGFALMLSDNWINLELRTCSDDSKPKLELKVSNDDLKLVAKKDSLVTFLDAVSYYLEGADLDPRYTPPASSTGGARPVLVADNNDDDSDNEIFESSVDFDQPRGMGSTLGATSVPQSSTPRNVSELNLHEFSSQPDLSLLDDALREDSSNTVSSAQSKPINIISNLSRVASSSKKDSPSLSFDENHFSPQSMRPIGPFHASIGEPILSSSPHLGSPYNSSSSPMRAEDRDMFSYIELGLSSLQLPSDEEFTVTTRRPIQINHDYLPYPSQTLDELKPEPFFPPSKTKICVENCNVHVSICGGYDWSFYDPIPDNHADRTRSMSSHTEPHVAANRHVHFDVPSMVDEETDSIVVLAESVPHVVLQPDGTLQAGTSGGFDTEDRMILALTGVNVAMDSFAEDAPYESRLLVLLHQIEIFDMLSMSKINKFMTDYHSEELRREHQSHMLRIDWIVERRHEGQEGEIMLRVDLLPLRFHLDQAAIIFLVDYATHWQSLGRSTSSSPEENPSPASTSGGPYFKICLINPLVAVVDYQPERVDLRKLFAREYLALAGLFYLDGSCVALPAVGVRGKFGLPELLDALRGEYLKDVPHQVLGLLQGLPGGRTVAGLARGVTRMVREPYYQYPKLARGLRDGLAHGSRATAIEMCNVISSLSFALQVALEVTQGVVAPDAGPSVPPLSRQGQPEDYSAGFIEARNVLLAALRNSYLDVARRPYERGDSSLRAIARSIGAVPGAGLRPLIGLCEALSLSFQGIRNSIRPEARREHSDKFKDK